MDLWGAFSTWVVIDYDGAFFRAEGTNANAFIEKTGSLVKQKQGTAKNGLSVFGNSQTVYTGGTISLTSNNNVNMNHFHKYSYYGSVYNTAYGNQTDLSDRNRAAGTENTSSVDLSHRHPLTFTPSVSISGGDVETRPENFTKRIWKRTA